jgi:transglutaminase-like putative cysteine protease
MKLPPARSFFVGAFVAAIATAPLVSQAAAPDAPKTRVYDVKQTVKLGSIPKDAKSVRLWIPIAIDAPSQKVLDFGVVDAPGDWRVEAQPDNGNRFLYVEVAPEGKEAISVVTNFTVERSPMRTDVDSAAAGKLTDVHRKALADYLDKNAPNMVVDARIQKMADDVCGKDDDVMSQARKLWTLVADLADHYSKDSSKPHCGRGNTEDCITNGGGCCTDLHSFFISLARARGIPSRMWFGYRLQAKNDGKEVDPGYRCWIEYFVPGYGWVASDIVVGDSGDKESRSKFVSFLDERRIVLNYGRNHELVPKQDGPRVNNMVPAYAEIDGKPVPVLPDASGKPSPLVRTVHFTERPSVRGGSGAGAR